MLRYLELSSLDTDIDIDINYIYTIKEYISNYIELATTYPVYMTYIDYGFFDNKNLEKLFNPSNPFNV